MVIYDLQKGSLLKRASAFILDGILLVILAVGFAFAASAIFHYNTYSDMYSDGIDRYAHGLFHPLSAFAKDFLQLIHCFR